MIKRCERLYIAGPYTNADPLLVDSNIEVARDACAEAIRRNFIPFSPITMTAWFDEDYPDIAKESYLQLDIQWLLLCDSIFMLPGWENSQGAREELRIAQEMGMKVYYQWEDTV